jgi:hypothetical protein
VVVVLLCPIVLCLSFLPVLPEAPHRIRVAFEAGQLNAYVGHSVIVAGNVYQADPPWWSNAWFMWTGMGAWATTALIASSAVAIVTIDRRLALYLGLAVAIPFAYLAFVYSNALPHYYFIWLAPLTLLAALGLDALASRGRRSTLLAAALGLLLAVAAVTTLIDVGRQRPGDYRATADLLRRNGLGTSTIAVLGYGPVLNAYLPGARLSFRVAAGTAVVVIDPLTAKRAGDPGGLQSSVGLHPNRYSAHCAGRLRIFIRHAGTPGSTACARRKPLIAISGGSAGDQEAVLKTLEGYHAALLTRRGRRACSYLTPAQRESEVATITALVKRFGHSCPRVLAGLGPLLSRVRIIRVDIEGGVAHAVTQGKKRETITLTKRGGRWLISHIERPL